MREFRAWMYRLDKQDKDELENPTPTQWTILRVAAEVRRLYKAHVKDTSPTSLNDLKLPLEDPTPKTFQYTEAEKQELIRRSKARWGIKE